MDADRDQMSMDSALSASNGVFAPPEDLLRSLDDDIEASGGELALDETMDGSIGRTMFDVPSSEDGTLTVLLPQGQLQCAPSQALLRIKSPDGRNYVGIVMAGPFAEPDSLRGDSPMLVTVATRGGIYLPPYHGRVQVAVVGEEQPDGTLVSPRLRPLPNSGVFPLSDEEAKAALHVEGDIRLGLVVGYEELPSGVPSTMKSVLPRHTAVLGTTGGGKSTTVARLTQQAQATGMAVIVLDVEGEYTFLHEPTDDPHMLSGLRERNLDPAGVNASAMTIYHLVGRETANPDHPRTRQFSLQFARLSPYAVAEILDLTEPQASRFHIAYDVAKLLLRDCGIFPSPGSPEQERLAVDFDEFERGYPRLTLSMLIDVVNGILALADKNLDTFVPFTRAFQEGDAQKLKARIGALGKIDAAVSWRVLRSKLWRLHRLGVFDREDGGVKPLSYRRMLRDGHVSVIDLSDTSMSELTNLVIADLLRGIQETQDEIYVEYERRPEDGDVAAPPRVLVVIEEAHEFLSADRIDKMPILFQQLARIAKRGRKRWLGLVFVTQFPQHLPRQVLGLVNSFVIHKITDPFVASQLKRTISGIDEGMWRRLPGLAQGQAIVSFPHMARPLLVSIDPTPAKLRLVD